MRIFGGLWRSFKEFLPETLRDGSSEVNTTPDLFEGTQLLKVSRIGLYIFLGRRFYYGRWSGW